MSANIAILAADGTILAVNAAWRDFAERYGCRSEAHCVGMNYLEVCKRASKDCREAKLAAAALQSIMKGDLASFRDSYELELEDCVHHFQLTISPIALADASLIAVCHEDVTATVRVEKERRLHALELVRAQDDERRQIARELHDSTAQHLTAIGLLSKLMLSQANHDQFGPHLRELADIVAQAQNEIRTFSFLLHPPLLAEIGLRPALERYIEGFSARTGVEVSFHWGLATADSADSLAHPILRIVQEALANVYRHSGARRASVRIEAAGSEISVTVSDTGSGNREGPAREGVGMASMRSRVAEHGGTLRMTQTRRGTKLRASFPCDSARSASDGASHAGP